MITLDIPDIGHRHYMPSDLSDCDTRQYNEICMLVYRMQVGEINYETFRLHALYALLNMQPVESVSEEAQLEKMSNIYWLSEYVDDFFEDADDGPKILKQYYVHNPTPWVRPRLWRYYGPSDDFANVRFGEYLDALNFFSEYHATKDNQYLYLLMATLYRPAKSWSLFRKSPNNYNSDRRELYNTDLVERRAKRMENLYFGQVYGFYLLFASFQKYLSSAKIYWQGKELDLSILFDSTETELESDIPGIGMKSVLYTLAESGVFGTKMHLEQENLWEILLRMYDLTKRDRDFKAKQDALKKNS